MYDAHLYRPQPDAEIRASCWWLDNRRRGPPSQGAGGAGIRRGESRAMTRVLRVDRIVVDQVVRAQKQLHVAARPKP